MSAPWIEADDGRNWGFSMAGSEQAAIDLVVSLSPDVDVVDERSQREIGRQRRLRR